MKSCLISTLFLVLLLSLYSCAAPRYATYKPNGDTGAPWKVKAEKTITGWVTVTINDQEVLKGQYPIFGESEVKGQYQGRDVKMVLLKRDEDGTTIFECLVYAEDNQIGRFRW